MEEANELKRMHGDAVTISQVEGQTFVQLKKGAVIYVPKALQFDRLIPIVWRREEGILIDSSFIFYSLNESLCICLDLLQDRFLPHGMLQPMAYLKTLSIR